MGKRTKPDAKPKGFRHEGYDDPLANEYAIGEYSVMNRTTASVLVGLLSRDDRLICLGMLWGLSFAEIGKIVKASEKVVETQAKDIANVWGCALHGIPLIFILAEGVRRPDELFDPVYFEKV